MLWWLDGARYAMLRVVWMVDTMISKKQSKKLCTKSESMQFGGTFQKIK